MKKIKYFRDFQFKKFSPAFLMVFVLLLFCMQPAYSAEPLKRQNAETIQISSDTLLANRAKLFSEFSGNVRVTNSDGSILLADRVKIIFKNDAEKKVKNTDNQSIKKIIADGNVEYSYEDKKAYTDKAVYTIDDQILVMTGPGSKIISGKSNLKGEKITLYRKDGRIKVASNSGKRVTAEFHSKSGDL